MCRAPATVLQSHVSSVGRCAVDNTTCITPDWHSRRLVVNDQIRRLKQLLKQLKVSRRPPPTSHRPRGHMVSPQKLRPSVAPSERGQMSILPPSADRRVCQSVRRSATPTESALSLTVILAGSRDASREPVPSEPAAACSAGRADLPR